MKKRLLSMLLVVVMMTSVLSVSALADDSAHTCVPGTWVGNGYTHETVCTDPACGLTLTGDCVDANQDFVCDVCGTHVCGEWALTSVDQDYHKLVCTYPGCGKEKETVAHTWILDTTSGLTTETNNHYYCDCGTAKDEHIHVWDDASLTYTADGHVRSCKDPACTVVDTAIHIWKYSSINASGTTSTFVCETAGCTETKTEHVCKAVEEWTKDATGHWHACQDPTCALKVDYEPHYDQNGEGTCDPCDYPITGEVVHAQLNVDGLSYPAVGNKIDFTVTVMPSGEYGNATVKWNRVISLSKDTSTAMNEDNVFAAGKLYNASITVPMNKGSNLTSSFAVYLNGTKIAFYTDSAKFQAHMDTYTGSNYVAAAYHSSSDGREYITICVMYPQLEGECSHPNLDYDNGTWLYNATNHYQVCDVCGDTLHVVKHFDFNGNGTCDRCGYNPNYTTLTSSGTTTHTHSWSTDWVEDISNHWYQCSTCGAKSSLAAHADGNGNGKCDTCGFVMTAESGHTHAFATTWTETAYQHYHLCACGAKNDIAAHVDLNNSGLCDQCGYTMTAALNAAASGTTAVTTTTTTTVGVATGDSTSPAVIGLWMAAFAVSVLGLGGSALAWRKRKES